MPSLAFHCRICSGSFGSRSAWLAHLIQDGHQNLARKELLRNWEGSEVKEEQDEKACSLVVYGKVPVGKDDRVIQYLSQDAFGVLVTDFVWWEGRPRVGVVQLESSDAVKKVMSALTNGEFRIDPDQVCRVVEGSKVEELEWEELLQGNGTDLNDPGVNGKGVPTPGDPDLTPSMALLVLTDVAASSTNGTGFGATNALEVSGELEIATSAIPSDPDPPANVVVWERNGNDEDQDMDTATGHDNTDLVLRDHLRTILELIEIPDEEYDTALEIHSQLQEVLRKYRRGKEFKKISFDAVLTRSWLLKLQYKPMSTRNLDLCVLILKDRANSDKCHHLFPNECKRIEKMLIKTEGGKTSFLSCEILGKVESYCGRDSGVFTMKEPSTKLVFDMNIVSNPLCFGDYQVWRLAQSLLTFDPHCYPVMAVAYYWASINSVVVGGRRGSHDHLPDPSALNWLVVLFFQKEGLIPSAKEILERPHQTKCLLGKDIGFSDCFRAALDWRKERNTFVVDTTTEEFAKEVFTLLQEFFLFCGALLGDGDKGVVDWGWILNTRDGEIIPKADVLSPERPKDCKLTDLELTEIKGALKGRKGKQRITMLQPFFLNWRISTHNAKRAFGAMNETGLRLKGYLDNQDQVVTMEKLGWEEFQKMLKLREEFVPLPEFWGTPRIPFKRSLSPTDLSEVASKKRKFEIPDEELGLLNHLKHIQTLTELPYEDSYAAREIMVRLQEALIEKNQNVVGKVAMCNPWILNLPEPTPTPAKEGSIPVLTFVIYDEEEQTDGSYKVNQVSSQQLADLEGGFVTMSKSKGEDEDNYKMYFLSNEIVTMSKEEGVLTYNVKLATGRLFEVKIVSNPTQLVQAQTTRFIKYLFGIDAHSFPVLALTYYWAKVNSIFGDGDNGEKVNGSMALNLLLMLFLQKEKLIPIPSKVLERPHSHKRLFLEEVDIGFAENPHFAKSWKNWGKKKKFWVKEEESEDGDIFAERVFTLLYKFFLFCGSKFGDGDDGDGEASGSKGSGWILNTREAKVIPTQGPSSELEEKINEMTCDDNMEATTVKESPEEENPETEKLIMFHPFFIDKKIPVTLTEQAFHGMKKTRMRLKTYLEGDGVGGKREKLELEEFLNLFQI